MGIKSDQAQLKSKCRKPLCLSSLLQSEDAAGTTEQVFATIQIVSWP